MSRRTPLPVRVRVWQRALLALGAFGVFQLGLAVFSAYSLYGIFGFGIAASVEPFVDRVVSIAPGTSAARTDLRVGDTVEVRTLTPPERFIWRSTRLLGQGVAAPVRRGTKIERVSLVADRTWGSTAGSHVWGAWTYLAGLLVMLLSAMLLALRRPESAEVRTLALALILTVVGGNFTAVNFWVTPWPALDAWLDAGGSAIYILGSALLATYAAYFGRPLRALRSALTWATYGSAFGYAAFSAAGDFGEWTGSIDPASPNFAHWPNLVFGPAVFVFALACALLAIRDARGADRSRITWVTASLGLLYVDSIAYFVLPSLGVHGYVKTLVINTTYCIAPLGLLYSLLNRRLLDVGFALNRAAAFTAVSLVVVGLFALVEWALAGWLQSAGRVSNIAVSAALSVALGLSILPIQRRTDRIVDNLFFRRRHDDELALKRFAREVAFITNRDTVLERARSVLAAHADCSAVEFLLDDGGGRFGPIDENDPALVRLRATHERVDLHLVDSEIPGEFAYPMLTRGRLVGTLVLGAKRSGESYAPDESAAIADLAHGVGVSLDLIETAPGVQANGLVEAVRALEDANRSIVAEVRALSARLPSPPG